MPWGQRPKGKRGSGWGWGGDGDGEGRFHISQTIAGIVEVVAGGVLRAGKTSYDDDSAGWWIGRDPVTEAGKINIGDESRYLKWSGSAVEIAGSISGSILEIVMATGGVIRAGKASFADTTAGWWLGDHLGTPKFSVGDASEGLTWDGAALAVLGAIGGTITDLLIDTSGAIRSAKSAYSDTTAGWWLGIDSGTPKLNIGNASYSLKWTGTALEVLGSIGGTVSNLVVSTNGAIRSGKTVFGDVEAGWWIGMDSGDPKIDIGAAQDHLQWDGSALDIVGAIGGTISALVLSATNSAIRAGKSAFSDTTAGFWLGLDTTTPKFNIGDASNYLQWNGSVLQIAGKIGGEITDFVLSSSGVFRANKTTYDDTTAGWWLGIDEDTAAKFNIGNGSNYLKWTGALLQVAGSISGKITDLQLSDNGVQVRAGKTSFADTTAGFWLGVSSGGYPQFHIGNSTAYFKFDASASPAITYAWPIDAVDIDFSSGIDIEAASSASAYTTSRFRWLNGSSAEIGYLDTYYNGSNQHMYQFVGRPPAAGSAVGAVGYTLDLRAGSGEIAVIEFIAGGGLIQIANSDYTGGGNRVVFDDIQEFLVPEAFMQLGKITEPAAPAYGGLLYLKDNGSGKTQLCVRFATGAVQVLATEP